MFRVPKGLADVSRSHHLLVQTIRTKEKMTLYSLWDLSIKYCHDKYLEILSFYKSTLYVQYQHSSLQGVQCGLPLGGIYLISFSFYIPLLHCQLNCFLVYSIEDFIMFS